jgi:hypothetical protein
MLLYYSGIIQMIIYYTITFCIAAGIVMIF